MTQTRQKTEYADSLSETRLHTLLRGSGMTAHVLQSVDSTNDECRRRLKQGERDFAVLAGTQTAGRGRCGKDFFSPPGAGLYMSAALCRALPPERAVGVTTYAAVCAAEEILRLTGADCRIKWVNDLFLAGRKVGGILTEAVMNAGTGMTDAVIVGIGLDLYPCAVPEALQGIMGCLDCGGAVRNELAAAILKRLTRFDGGRAHMEAYRRLSLVTGRRVSYTLNGRLRSGIAAEIGDDGALAVDTESGRDILRSGEISLSAIDGLR